jgi:hypothetical protein
MRKEVMRSRAGSDAVAPCGRDDADTGDDDGDAAGLEEVGVRAVQFEHGRERHHADATTSMPPLATAGRSPSDWSVEMPACWQATPPGFPSAPARAGGAPDAAVARPVVRANGDCGAGEEALHRVCPWVADN